MKAKACAHCGEPLSASFVRHGLRRFCSEDHVRKYVEKKELWKGVEDSGNVGGPGC